MSTKQLNSSHSQTLTKYPTASLKELLTLSIPLIFATLSGSLLTSCDQYFLSLYSIDAWQACSAARILCLFFQISCMMITVVSRVFIAYYKGARREQMIGPFIWQMIYFSILSMLITYPLSFLSELYLKGIQAQDGAILYFRFFAITNFLYPLGTTLVSFYLGRGKSRVIVLVTIITQALNAVLDYLFIFGFKGIIPSMGIQGAAIATIISQALFCLIFFVLFLQKKYMHRYATYKKTFNLPLLMEGLKTGFPRALGRTIVISAWLSASYSLIHRGGDYQLVHTLGITLFIPLYSINEGVGQAILILISYTLGAGLKNVFLKIIRTSVSFICLTTIFLAIPLLFNQDFLIHIFVKDPPSPHSLEVLRECCLWLWFLYFANGLSHIGTSFITASKDTLFYAFCAPLFWVTLFLPVFIGITKLGWSPSKFFLIEAVSALTMGAVYILRFLSNPERKNSSRMIQINLLN